MFAPLITALLLSSAVNVSRSQLLYSSLVNMDVQKDELSQAVQERLLLAPTSCCHSNKGRGGPSHLIFMTSDLMRQQPFSSEEGTAKSKLCPQPPSSRSAFDLYRRQKCHEATSWLVCLAPQCFKNKKIMNIINLTRNYLYVNASMCMWSVCLCNNVFRTNSICISWFILCCQSDVYTSILTYIIQNLYFFKCKHVFFFFSMAWFPHWQDWFTGVSQSFRLLIKATFQQSLSLCWLPTLRVTSSSSPLFHFLWFCASFGSFKKKTFDL